MRWYMLLFASMLGILAGCNLNGGGAGDFSGPPPAPVGESYYVAESGRDSGSGLASDPWRTITHALSMSVMPGDEIIIGSGEYDEEVKLPRGLNGEELLPVTDGIEIHQGNRIVFPPGTVLDAVRPGDYLYVYRSRNGNSGAFPIYEVRPRTGEVFVRAGSFPAYETRDSAADHPLCASIGRPIILRGPHDATMPRVPLIAVGINYDPTLYGGIFDDNYGNNYVVIAAFDVTTVANSQAGGIFINGDHNVVQFCHIHDGPSNGVTIRSRLSANYTIIQNNRIGNNAGVEGVYVGAGGNHNGQYGDSEENGNSQFSHILGNEFFGTIANQPLENAIEIKENNPATGNANIGSVIAGNNIESVVGVNGNGQIQVGAGSSHTLVYGNTIRSLSAAGSHSAAGILLLLNDRNGDDSPSTSIELYENTILWEGDGEAPVSVTGIRVSVEANRSATPVADAEDVRVYRNAITGIAKGVHLSGSVPDEEGVVQVYGNSFRDVTVSTITNSFGRQAYAEVSNNVVH